MEDALCPWCNAKIIVDTEEQYWDGDFATVTCQNCGQLISIQRHEIIEYEYEFKKESES